MIIFLTRTQKFLHTNFFTPWYADVLCAYQGVGNYRILYTFTNALNKLSPWKRVFSYSFWGFWDFNSFTKINRCSLWVSMLQNSLEGDATLGTSFEPSGITLRKTFWISESYRAPENLLISKCTYFQDSIFVNSFVPNGPFLYTLKTSENLKVFWYFQGAEKGCIGNEWVKIDFSWFFSKFMLLRFTARTIRNS